MPTTVQKKVRARADQILPQFRAQFGVTDEDVAKGKSARSIVVNPALSVSIGDTLDEAITLHGEGDVEKGKAHVLRCYRTQAVTLAQNTERVKFAKAVSDTVKDAEAIVYAFKVDGANAAAVIGSGDMGKTVEYLDGIKEKIRAERQKAGTAPVEEDDDDEAAA